MSVKKDSIYFAIFSLFFIFHDLTAASRKKPLSKKSIARKVSRMPYAGTPLRKLNHEQLEEVFQYTEKERRPDSQMFIELLELLIACSDEHVKVKRYKLQLADYLYQHNQIEKAATLYEDFITLYPSSDKTEYAHYQAIACVFNLSLDHDRDQTNTIKVIELVTKFLTTVINQDYKEEAKTIKQTCIDRLYDHEVYVLNFYLKKRNYEAVQLRLDYIETNFKDTILDFDKKIKALKDSIKNIDLPASKDVKTAPALQSSETEKRRKFLA